MAVLVADSGDGDLYPECDEDNIIKAVQVGNIDRFYIYLGSPVPWRDLRA